MNRLVAMFRGIPWRYYGVWLLPICGLMGFAGYGSVLYTWPVFFPVIIKDLGWSAAIAATASSLARMEGGIEGPLVGWVLDKYGPRIVMLISGVMIGLGFISLHWMNSIWFYYIVFGIIINLGYNAGLYTSSYKAVATWWVKWRARGIAIMILPTAIAGTFGPSVGTWAIQQWGWQNAVMAMGALVLVIFIPAAVLVRPKRPEAYGTLPDGDDPKKAALEAEKIAEQKASEEALARATMKKEVDWTTREAAKSSTFWLFTVANVVNTFASQVMLLFVPSHLIARGFDVMTAAFYAGLMMSITYIGRFTVIAIGDVFSPKWQLVIAWVLQGFAAFSLANASPQAPLLAVGYAALYGVGYGMAIPLSPAVRGWFFGRSSFGTIGGYISLASMVTMMIAPIFAGYVYDTTKTYYLAYMAFGVAFVLGAGILAFAKRPVPKPIPELEARPVPVSSTATS